MPTRRKSVADKRIASSNAHIRIAAAITIIVVFSLFMGIDYLMNFNKFYPGVKINNIDVSGLSKADAETKLKSSFDDNLNSKVLYIFTNQEDYDTINVEDYLNQQDLIAEQISALQAQKRQKVFTTSASEIGASYDYTSAINKAFEVAKSANPFERIGTRLFGSNTELSLELGEGLDELFSKVSATTGERHIDYNVEINDGIATVTSGKDGNFINQSKFSSTIAETLVSSDITVKKLLFEPEYDPILINEEKAQNLADKINSAIENGATFNFRDKDMSVNRKTLGSWIKTKITGNTPDEAQINAIIDTSSATSGLSSLVLSNVDASNVSVSITVVDGSPKIHPNGDVIVPKLEDAITVLQSNLFEKDSSDTSTVKIAESDQKDNFDLQSALYAGLIREVSSYTTTYTSSSSTANRNHNIHLVSDYITNSVISANGGIFSYNNAAGPCTAEEGFLEASAISADEVVQEVAGGICQVATTVFNAAYNAGLPIKERYPHSLRMSSYPAGRDAAVSVPELDLKFENDTTSDMLLLTSYTETSVTVKLYGLMDERRVVTETGSYEEDKKYTTKYEENSSLAQGSWSVKTVGTNGTKITVERKVYNSDGSLLYDNFFASTYSPVNEVIQYGPGTDLTEVKKSRENES